MLAKRRFMGTSFYHGFKKNNWATVHRIDLAVSSFVTPLPTCCKEFLKALHSLFRPCFKFSEFSTHETQRTFLIELKTRSVWERACIEGIFFFYISVVNRSRDVLKSTCAFHIIVNFFKVKNYKNCVFAWLQFMPRRKITHFRFRVALACFFPAL